MALPGDLVATHSLAPAQPKAAEPAYLLIVEASSSRWLPLPSEGALLIGRGEEADLALSDAAASRRHARILVSASEVRVADLDSRNGTRVNGQPISGTVALATGDVVSIGEVSIILRCKKAPPAARVLLDGSALRRRLDEEVVRAQTTQDALAVAVFTFTTAPDAGALARALDPALPILRIIDVAALLGPQELVVVLPGLEVEAARPVADSIARALGGADVVKVGLAAHPADGAGGDTLIAAARSLAARADGGSVADSDRLSRIQLGDRAVIVADPAMLRLYGLIKRLAPSDLPVLIRGETGSGKENAAQALHTWSPRAAAPFVAINCAALPETLVESELFGSEKGAYSNSTATKPGLLEMAEGGTVFFDELGELPRAVQPKLLRVIETKKLMRLGGTKERTINVRFIAATNRDLEEEVRAGRFREDLLYRVNAATVVLPPLRDRPSEIATLARLFLTEASARIDLPPRSLSTASIHELCRHGWPGNVRELKNVIEFMAATVEESVIEPWHLRARLGAGERRAVTSPSLSSAPATAEAAEPLVQTPAATEPVRLPTDPSHAAAGTPRAFTPIADELREIEQRRMAEALESAGGIQTRAAELIGMPLRTFQQKVKLYGLVKAR